MLGRISTFNPSSVQPKAAPLPTENGVVRGQRELHRQGVQNRRLEQIDTQHAQKRKDQAFERMSKNPRQAAVIAKQHGIEVTPEMEELFKNEAATKMVLEGATLAKNLGIERYEAAQQFVKGYVQSNGDALAAQQSVAGMNVRNPRKASYGHQVKIGDNLYDRNTGEIIIQGQGSSDPWDNPNLPPNLAMEGKILSKGNSLTPTDDVSDWYERAQPYMGGKDGLPKPPVPVPNQSMVPGNAPPAPEPGAQYLGYDAAKGVDMWQGADGKPFGMRNAGN
jgi:hypothetical protein